jgi:hypothetical protein
LHLIIIPSEITPFITADVQEVIKMIFGFVEKQAPAAAIGLRPNLCTLPQKPFLYSFPFERFAFAIVILISCIPVRVEQVTFFSAFVQNA